jgi:hypothetical protein
MDSRWCCQTSQRYAACVSSFPLRQYANFFSIAQKALQNGRQYIQKSLGRVAKKRFAGREGEIDEWTGEVLGNIKMVTDP